MPGVECRDGGILFIMGAVRSTRVVSLPCLSLSLSFYLSLLKLMKIMYGASSSHTKKDKTKHSMQLCCCC